MPCSSASAPTNSTNASSLLLAFFPSLVLLVRLPARARRIASTNSSRALLELFVVHVRGGRCSR